MLAKKTVDLKPVEVAKDDLVLGDYVYNGSAIWEAVHAKTVLSADKYVFEDEIVLVIYKLIDEKTFFKSKEDKLFYLGNKKHGTKGVVDAFYRYLQREGKKKIRKEDDADSWLSLILDMLSGLMGVTKL